MQFPEWRWARPTPRPTTWPSRWAGPSGGSFEGPRLQWVWYDNVIHNSVVMVIKTVTIIIESSSSKNALANVQQTLTNRSKGHSFSLIEKTHSIFWHQWPIRYGWFLIAFFEKWLDFRLCSLEHTYLMAWGHFLIIIMALAAVIHGHSEHSQSTQARAFLNIS